MTQNPSRPDLEEFYQRIDGHELAPLWAEGPDS